MMRSLIALCIFIYVLAFFSRIQLSRISFTSAQDFVSVSSASSDFDSAETTTEFGYLKGRILTASEADLKTAATTAFDSINKLRVNKGVAALKWNDGLYRICLKLCKQLVKKGWKSDLYKTQGTRAEQSDLEWQEYVDQSFQISGRITDLANNIFKQSTQGSSLANVINPNFEVSAIGVAQNSDGSFYVTQALMRPYPGPKRKGQTDAWGFQNVELKYPGKVAFDWTNKLRVGLGLNALMWDDNVYNYSVPHSYFQDNTRVITHQGAAHVRCRPISALYHLKSFSCAENVGWNEHYGDPGFNLYNLWLHSPPHYANMIGNYTISAVAVVRGDRHWQATQGFFWLPKGLSNAPFKPVPGDMQTYPYDLNGKRIIGTANKKLGMSVQIIRLNFVFHFLLISLIFY